MTDTLLQAYTPLLVWSLLGIGVIQFFPESLPRFLGRSLYWVGVPLEIFALSRQTDWSAQVGLAPSITIATLFGGLLLSVSILAGLRWLSSLQPAEAAIAAPPSSASSVSPPLVWQASSRQGSFLLSSVIGNTGFVGLAIAPTLIDQNYLGWIVFYSVTNNIIGTYGLGVWLASAYGRHATSDSAWWKPLRDVFTVPTLWAFVLGFTTHNLTFPGAIEQGLKTSVWIVIPIALLLMGMRLRQLKGWQSLRLAIAPTFLKVLIIPALVGLATTLLALPPAPRLAMVLMSGMPTAFAGLILAEEYNLDRDLIASSILLSTLALLLTIPLWLWLFATPTWIAGA